MSITRAFTLRTLAKNRVRTAVTIVGIALSAALLTAIFTSLSSLNSFLYNQEIALNGAWQASATTADLSVVEAAEANPQIGDSSTLTELGTAALPFDAAQTYGSYLTLRAIDDNYLNLGALELTEGRLPENSNEIVLYALYQGATEFGEEPLEVGSTLTLEVGKRQALTADGTPAPNMPEYLDCSYARLSKDDYTAEQLAENPDLPVQERLAEVGAPREYTVVGFYLSTSTSVSGAVGTSAFTYADNRTAAPTADGTPAAYETFFTVPNAKTVDDIENVARATFGKDASVYFHNGLLRYAGITDNRTIWDTLYYMVAILAAVIVVASISLIYNSFAISIAERTRQFGLLASVGASRRQIRRAVFMEAGVLGLIGIPLGLAVGVAGSAVVLTALSPALSEVLGGKAQFGLQVEPLFLAIAAALSLVIVLLSAYLPALRASRVSAVDAIRNASDTRITKTTARTDPQNPWKPRATAPFSRLFGISGALAWRNAHRSKGKGFAAVLSLTVAVVLLVTAGVLDTTLRSSVRTINSAHDCDVAVHLYGELDEVFEPFMALADSLDATDGVIPMGRTVITQVPVTVPADMATDDLRNDTYWTPKDDGSVEMEISLVLLDGESYRTYLESAGLDVAQFLDAENPPAIANFATYSNNGETYEIRTVLGNTGSIELFRYDIETYLADKNALAYSDVTEIQIDETTRGVSYLSEDYETVLVPRAEAATSAGTLEIGALVDELPPAVGANTQLFVVLPLTDATLELMGSVAGRTTMVEAPYYAENHVLAAKTFNELVKKVRLDSVDVSVVDLAAEKDNNDLLITVISTFSFSFAAILTLIAVANVFNTLVNSLTLRRREFAMLRSVGMGNAAFNRMVVWECLRYGAIALVAGIALSFLVAWGLHEAMSLSIDGLAFALPWGHIGIAVVVVLCATVISTAYGLHRARSGNVVEALRTDVM